MSRSARIRLAHVALHPDRRRSLVERLGNSARVLRAIERGAVEVPDSARAAAAVPADVRYRQAANDGYEIVVLGDAGYPATLAGLPDAPDVLFVRGTLPTHPGVAIVGTRRCTTYGREVAHDFGAHLAAAGWPIVSGLAYGVDAAAHEGTVLRNGHAVAVMGCGIDRWYPLGNAGLGRRLLATGGVVVSEYPPGTPPVGWRFPPRNRIISGLSAIVVVVEAAVTGGALITARYALEQGRDVFAVPGDVDRPTSAGANRLIRDGAWPVFDAADLVESVERIAGQPVKGR